MGYLKVLVLAVVQGIAEFLPVSSSGHLQVLGNWFGFDAEANMTLNIVLHAGTLLAILIFYFQKLLSLLLEALFRRKFRVIALVIAGSVPTGIIGIAIKKTGLDATLFGSVWVPAAGFAVTATLLWNTFRRRGRKASPQSGKNIEELGFGQAVAIGIAQGIAIMPGISRSGSTIASGVKCGLKSTDAAEFSFLLAIPAIAGAMLLEILKLAQGGTAAAPAVPFGVLAAGFLVSAAVGYCALMGLIALLRGGKLVYFAYYLYAAAALVAAVALIRG